MSLEKKKIADNFSASAHDYDKYSRVQVLVARKLADLLGDRGARKILDLGCGTGGYTGLLREKFEDAEISGVDISREMVDQARKKFKDGNIKFIQSDICEFEPGQKFDLITSNACLQWVDDLGKLLAKYKRFLSSEGRIVFSIFGKGTYLELAQCFSEVYGRDVEISSSRFFSKQELYKLLSNLFDEYRIEEMISFENFSSLRELLKMIKLTGTRGMGLDRPLGKEKLIKTEEAFKRNYGCVRGSYQIFFVTAEVNR